MFILLLEIAILHGLHKLRNRACGMLLQSTCKSLDQFCLTIQYWITKCLWLTAREKGLYIQNIKIEKLDRLCSTIILRSSAVTFVEQSNCSHS
jgi:hypothetical protein